MAKSKLIKANKKIAEGVTTGFQKMSDGVVGGFQKMSDGVVGGYKKIEDAFVDRYLTKDGESIEEAKMRLNTEEEVRRETAKAEYDARQQFSNEIIQQSMKKANTITHH